jgi:DNA-binding MarR family transcriptional regulator
MASGSRTKTSPTPRAQPSQLSELFSYRLNRLAYVSSRIAAGINESRYGVGPREWRIIALLGASAPMSLNALARASNIDKSQVSRTVSDLIERGLVKRSADEQDARGIRLDLAGPGRTLYKKVFPAAVTRNETLLDVLSEDERALMEDMLDRLTAHALEMLNELKDEAPPRRGRGVQPR